MQFNIHSVITDCKVCHYAGDAKGEFRVSPSPTSWLSQSDLWDDDHELASASTLSSELSPHVTYVTAIPTMICVWIPFSVLPPSSCYLIITWLGNQPAVRHEAVVYVNLILQAPWLFPSSWIQRPPACFATKCGGGAGHPWWCSGTHAQASVLGAPLEAGDQMYHALQQTYIQL